MESKFFELVPASVLPEETEMYFTISEHGQRRYIRYYKPDNDWDGYTDVAFWLRPFDAGKHEQKFNEYAKLYHAEQLKSTPPELPSVDEINQKSLNEVDEFFGEGQQDDFSDCSLFFRSGANWMRTRCSEVIANKDKELDSYRSILDDAVAEFAALKAEVSMYKGACSSCENRRKYWWR